MGIGAYSRLRPERESIVQEPAEPVALNPMRMMRSAVSLQGNGQIGQIANLQAGLNHSGLLGDDTLFVVSDVVDAVNYKSGDVTPVLHGLLERYCREIREGNALADSAAVRRVLPLVERHWAENYAAEYPEGRLRLERRSWIKAAQEGLEQARADAELSLWHREMFANGPVDWLLCPLQRDETYREAIEFNELHSRSWRDLLQEREQERAELPEGNENLLRQFDARWSVRLTDLARDLQEAFLVKLLGMRNYAVELLAAWQQIEALRGTRIMAGRPLNLRLMLWEEEQFDFSDRDWEWIRQARQDWAGGMVLESLLLPLAPEQMESLDWAMGERLRWDGRSLESEDGGEMLAVLNSAAGDLLRWRAVGGEKLWQWHGLVGGDGPVGVLLPMSN